MKTPPLFLCCLALLFRAGLLHAATPATSSPSPAVNEPGLEEKLRQMTPEEREQFFKDHPEFRERFRHEREEMLDRLRDMTPEQRQEFLQNHPQIQRFLNNHPEQAQKLAGGPETGSGVKDPGHPPENDFDKQEEHEREEMFGILRSMSPEQRQQFLQNHPGIQHFFKDHPEFAQKLLNGSEAGAGIKDPGHPRVNEVNNREQNEQQRINQGVANGTINPQQAAKLDGWEKRIQQQEARDLEKHNGHLTADEDHRLNREENRESHAIHRDNHDQKNGGNDGNGASPDGNGPNNGGSDNGSPNSDHPDNGGGQDNGGDHGGHGGRNH